MIPLAAAAAPQFDQVLDRLGKRAGVAGAADQDNNKVTAGLKEALQVGAANAITRTGKVDGFFGNEAIKILLPENFAPWRKACVPPVWGRKWMNLN